jgi:hypothetical protein
VLESLNRFWAVRDGAGELICVCVYKRGALEVARRLAEPVSPPDDCLRETGPGRAGAERANGFPLSSLGHFPRLTVARLMFGATGQNKHWRTR